MSTTEQKMIAALEAAKARVAAEVETVFNPIPRLELVDLHTGVVSKLPIPLEERAPGYVAIFKRALEKHTEPVIMVAVKPMNLIGRDPASGVSIQVECHGCKPIAALAAYADQVVHEWEDLFVPVTYLPAPVLN